MGPREVTVDVEMDWGGRTTGRVGLAQGLPWLGDLLQRHQTQGTFFISTSCLDEATTRQMRELVALGHRVGSHGHLHRSWRLAKWHEWRLDYLHSMTAIEKTFGLRRHEIPYRAPKFSRVVEGQRYSDPRGHVSLLRHLWLKEPITKETILYLHPFDLVEPTTPPPNLFCRVWYSRPLEARVALERLLCSSP